MRRARVFAACVLALLAGACGILMTRDAGPARLFSHRKHVVEEGLECASCHSKAAKEDGAGMPVSLKKCMLCHEQIDEGRDEGKKLAQLYGEKPVWTHLTEQPADIKFSHREHVTEGKLACGECHKGIEADAGLAGAMVMPMEDCMSCHVQRRAANECLTCHTDMRTDAPPPSHALNWKRTHGIVLRTGDESSLLNRCSLCHTDASCASCHQDEAPASHTNFWRLKGHAAIAGVDRSSCATCHQDDFCVRCHRETPPLSHRAGWGSPRSRHCLSCHDAGGSGCALCHEDGTPGHDEAPEQPSWHTPGMNCRQCHGVTQPLLHPDKGDDCNACHR